jgi:hypothetical protein
MTTQQLDVAAVVGLSVIGFVAGLSVWLGGEGGLQVASAAVGGIAGWLARSTAKGGGLSVEPPATLKVETPQDDESDQPLPFQRYSEEP